jgi:hypothetical protein
MDTVCWTPVCWTPVCWTPVCWTPASKTTGHNPRQVTYLTPAIVSSYCCHDHHLNFHPHKIFFFFFPMARQPLGGLGLLIFRGFTITQFTHTTLGRTPLHERPARRRDLYLTTHNTHKRQTSMPPAGFEPTIPASERP